MRRKILMGVLALALPAGTLALTSSAAVAKKPPPNPISCTGFSAEVVFGTPLTVDGQTTALKKGGNPTTVGGGTFSCAGGITGSSPLLTIPAGKNTKVSKGVYKTGTWAQFAAAGGSLKKSLKTINFTINGGSDVFKAKTATIVVGGACGGDVGFMINGQVTGTYNTKTADILACLGADDRVDASTGSFLADYLVYNGNPPGNGTPGSPTGGVDSAVLDPAVSSATL